MEENIINNNNNIYIDKNKEWICEKCKNKNIIDVFRCSLCNYFNYDVYSGNYGKLNKKENNKKKEKDLNPIIIKDNYIDYNDKENYEFKREERHKFIKCWHCGRENIYYKLKCNYCRFPINDSQEPKIKKTQLTVYDILHGITFEDKPKEEKKKNFKDIKIKNNNIKEEKKYNNIGKIWTCKFCSKLNKESIKYCSFCFKNRL